MSATLRTRLRSGTYAAAIGLAVLAAERPAAQRPGGPPGGAPGGPPDFMAGMSAMFSERPLVKQFDGNADGRLDTAERKAARAWLAGQPLVGPAAFFGPGRGAPPPGAPPFPGFGGPTFAPAAPGRKVTPAEVRSYGTAALYDPATFRTVFVQFEDADWEKELADFNNTDVEVPATVVVDGVTYRDVGVHFRGMSSFMMVPAGSKRSLNLSFDFIKEDQRLLGYRTVNLLNSNGDPTLMRGMVYADIAQHYVQVPKTNYVRVVINGESWGVYVNAEQFNADFVRARFGSARGARWKVPGRPFGQGGMAYVGNSVEAYKANYEIKSNDDPKSWTDLISLFRVLNQTPADTLEAALAPILDVDGVLKFLALEIALVNSDGYWARASDYSIYQDEKRRFHVVPHDYNEVLAAESFGGGPGPGGRGRGGPGRGGPGRGASGPSPGFPPGFPTPDQMPPGFPPLTPGGFAAIFPNADVDLDPLFGLDDATKPLRSKLLAVPALRTRYLGYVREIAERRLEWKAIEPVVRRLRGVIAAELKADTRKLYSYEAFEEGLGTSEEGLQRFVERRRAFLLKSR
jgi:hypothetical protein